MNRFGQHGAWFPVEEINAMLAHQYQDAFILLSFLRAHNGPWATFMYTNSVADILGWRRHRLAQARLLLIELGYLVPVRQSGYRTAALFRWGE